MKKCTHMSELVYVPIDLIDRAIRRVFFEPCRIGDAGLPWEDLQ